jgi:SAM-dependent methyltransferase/uncharacterized protein YbaR (Trm112 family)
MTELAERLACPRCDKTPLQQRDDALRCEACKVDFPFVGGMPWLFADPEAALGEWRGRLQFALQQLDHETATLEQELKAKDLPAMTRHRVQRYKDAVAQHRQSLQALLQPVQLQSLQGKHETYLALRTRLPTDQGLNTYYANVHRDWAWGAQENDASLEQVRAVLGDVDDLGDVLVLGCGAGRLAYDMHMQLNCKTLTAMDFNPLLMLVAETVTKGEKLDLFEFPIAPLGLEDDAVLRTLEAPEPVRDDFQLVFGDVFRAPFPAQSFDTVVTPWLIDILTEDLSVFASRLNNLLTDKGRWINFGSLAFTAPQRSRRYSPEETSAIAVDSGFSQPIVSQASIPYMCSPASRHGRQETVFTFCASRDRGVTRPPRYKALPDWIVTGKEPVPLIPSFRSQAMTTRIYAFIMSLIDGRRSLKDMAEMLEQQKLMTKEEAEPAIRSFLTKMYDDAQRQSGF